MSLKQPKSGMRPGSSMGMRPGSSMDRHDEEEEDAPRRLYGDSSPIDSGIGMGKGEDDEFSGRLKMQLAEKDRQLREQAASLIEMENSLTELQSFMATANSGGAGGQFDDADSAQLRSLLREKNDKIHVLTGEFDAHRADFRSTIDTLELASSETERVYERRVEDLLMEIRELQDRNEDVESVARQLKQLEELVAELEEGLEDARRGEAEARGEVEFLRGEVERSREELRREKEKSAAAVANAAVSKMRNGSSEEVEKKDDEIRGLKAIINSLSRDSVSLDDVSSQPAPSPAENLTVQISELQNQIMSKVNREEELEREIEELRKKKEARTSASSEKTVTPWANRASGGDQRGSGPAIGSWRNRQGVSSSGSSLRNITVDTKELSVSEEKEDAEFLTPIGSDVGSSSTAPWCEICEAAGHDILTCTNMFGTGAGGPASAGPNGSTTAVAAAEKEIQPEPKIHRQASSYSIAEGPSGCPPSASPAPPSEDSMAVSDLADKKKTVHLPYLTANVDINSPFGPVAGKDSGIVEADKWCALCERDGHDSVDCPLEMDY